MQPFWPRRSRHFLACRRAVRPFDAPAVIGLSGGPDSLALAAAAAAEGKDVRCVVVDHGLQPGSAQVAGQAARAARGFGLRADVARVEVGAGNLEAAAREARYATLLSYGEDVWVAHTADDQAETLVLGALRGNPSGMSPRNGRVVRPFLGVRRADTVGACEELGLEPWHDPMNADPAFRRVAVRRQVLPLLSELLGGDAVPALAATADRIAADQALIASLTDLTPTTSCAQLRADAGPVRRRRLAAWLLGEGVPVQGDQLAAVEALVVDWHGQGPVAVAGGRKVVRDGGTLALT
ncbi:tRNA lysidine(34) synthetase TilS [Corynebacterium sp. zg912]|uniref:tRNA(Ile)-lysidine synthase n=1 Tax=Corynebacterium wankanglinii TaxID=2735136 RepID=A0A7V8UVI8_9CORY|nr:MULTISPECIES: tRNA lysidine(34) synthetase TilS [Corynebacterium]MBA1838140.1 tRNA lysidine(34) synthetase TilS [Corynebacterium wankanglinii]MCR5929385.1 tRNA lysidine(34) synthetase TilS [Corynebacterium sp. zg912]